MGLLKPGFIKDKVEVVVWTGKYRANSKIWLCKCECGNYVEFTAVSIAKRINLHCGCLRSTRSRSLANSLPPVLYNHLKAIWQSMISSCDDPNHPEYHSIGKQNITYCKTFSTFNKFVLSVPTGYSVNKVMIRKNLARGFVPSNVKWVSYKVKRNMLVA